MRVACLYSGGKDSNFAVFWALTQGFEPILITVKGEKHSMMFHHPNIDKTKLQAKALGLKQYFLETDDAHWFENLKKLLKKLKVEGIAAGALASEYQRRRIDKLGEELGIPTYAPLWHKKEEMLSELLEYFEIYVTAVAADGLEKDLLGKPYKKLVEQVKAKGKEKEINIYLEGGEGETFVSNAPFFKHAIKIKKWKKTWEKTSGEAQIKETC
ncbi:MAG: diphthine--ammonia ligase [Candidatus Micrarchaeota archaeon]